MSDQSVKPTALLIYASTGQPLTYLKEECDAIEASLNASGLCNVEIVAAATLSDIVSKINEPVLRDRIVLVHYAGHANGRGLQLRSEDVHVESELAHMRGLAGVLNQQPHLRFLFINGCASRDQVLELTQAGIPLVIATNQGIDDKVARDFADRFYQTLQQERSIGDSFQVASDTIQATVGHAKRSLYFGDFKNFNFTQNVELPWEIHGPGIDRQWTLSTPYYRGTGPQWDHTKYALNLDSPYLGLRYFSEHESDRFFGRDDLVQRLLTSSQTAPLLFVVGASGTGKSSVVRAGMIPNWKARHQPVGSPRVIIFTPEDDPFDQLSIALATVDSFDRKQVRRVRQRTSWTALRDTVDTFGQGEPWLIFVDQLEQVFTRTTSESKRDAFFASIVDLATANRAHVCLVLAMRDDFFPHLRQYPELFPITDRHFERVAALNRTALREVIERPAAEHGVTFEPGLVDDIIGEIEGQPGALPLLQYTLNALWNRSDPSDRVLNKSAYRQLGGVSGSVGRRFKHLYDIQDFDGKNQFRWMMLKLVTYDEGSAETSVVSRLAPMSEFADKQAEFVDHLVTEEKLLVSSGTSNPAVQLGHEKIIQAWPEFTQWTREHQAANIVRHELSKASSMWAKLNAERARSEPALWQGSQLAKALELREQGAFDRLGGLDRNDTRSLDASYSQSRKLERRLLWAVLSALAALVVLSILGWRLQSTNDQLRTTGGQLSTANDELRTTVTQRDIALSDLQSQLYASRMMRMRDLWSDDYFGDGTPYSPMTNLLEQDLPGPGEPDHRTFPWYYWWRLTHAKGAEIPEREAISAVDPSDTFVAVCGAKDQIWDILSEKPVQTLWLGKTLDCTDVSRDGSLLAIATDDGRIAITDIPSGTQRSRFVVRSAEPTASRQRTICKLSPSDPVVLTIFRGNVPRIWNVDDGSLKAELRPRGNSFDGWSFRNMRFSRSGRRVAVEAHVPDGEFTALLILVFDLTKGTELTRFRGTGPACFVDDTSLLFCRHRKDGDGQQVSSEIVMADLLDSTEKLLYTSPSNEITALCKSAAGDIFCGDESRNLLRLNLSGEIESQQIIDVPRFIGDTTQYELETVINDIQVIDETRVCIKESNFFAGEKYQYFWEWDWKNDGLLDRKDLKPSFIITSAHEAHSWNVFASNDGKIDISSKSLNDSRTFREARGQVQSLQYSSAGKLLAVVNRSGSVSVVTTEDGEVIRVLDPGMRNVSCRFVENDAILKVANDDGSAGQLLAKHFSTDDWKVGKTVLAPSVNEADRFRLSPNEKLFVGGSSEGLCVFDAESGTKVCDLEMSQNILPYLPHFSGDSRRLHYFRFDNSAPMSHWWVDSGDHSYVANTHDAERAYLNGDDLFLFKKVPSNYSDRTEIIRWSSRRKVTSIVTGTGQRGASFTASRKWLVSRNVNAGIRFFARHNLLQVEELDAALRRRSCFAPDSRTAILSNQFWDVDSCELLDISCPFAPLAFSPNGMQIACSSESGVKLLSYPSMDIAATLDGLVANADIAWSSNRIAGLLSDRSGASGSNKDQVVGLWDRADGHVIASLNHTDRVSSIVISEHLSLVATGSLDGKIRLWRLGDGHPIAALDSRPVRSFSISPDGKYLASLGSGEDVIRIWDLVSRKPYHVISGSARCVLFAPDGRSLITMDSVIGRFRVWDLSSGLETFSVQVPNPKAKVAVAPDGRTLLSAQHRIRGSRRDSVDIWRGATDVEVFLDLSEGYTSNDPGARVVLACWGLYLAIAENRFAAPNRQHLMKRLLQVAHATMATVEDRDRREKWKRELEETLSELGADDEDSKSVPSFAALRKEIESLARRQ